MIRKIQYNAYGDPSVLEMVESDEPTPGEGEVRVTVKAVGLNPIDLKTFEGYKRFVSQRRATVCVTRPGGLAAVPHVFRRVWGVTSLV